MPTKLFITVVVVAVVCGSVCAQSLLMDKGQWGLYVQGAFANGIEVHNSAGEADLGIALGDRFDFGASLQSAQGARQVGPFTNIYPVKINGQVTTFLVGVHAGLGFHTSQFGSNSSTVGATLNLMIHTSAKTGFLLGGGYFGNAVDGREGTTGTGMIGISPYIKTKGGHPISLMIQYGFSDEFNTFGAGISLGLVKERAKN